MTVAVGLDLSLTGSGIVRITLDRHDRPAFGVPTPQVRHRRLSSDTAGQDVAARSRRLRRLAAHVCEEVMVDGPPGLVLVEQPAYGQAGGAVHDRSGLWWLVIARLTLLELHVAEVPPAQLKMYALGVGKGGKDEVLSAVIRRYGPLVPDLHSNDEADALVLAAAAWHKLTGAPLVPLPATHTRTLDRIRWPSTLETQEGTRA